MIKYSLIIPCYNESETLPKLVTRCAETLFRDEIEVIFVDNGSTDNTAEVLSELLTEYPNGRSVRVDVNQGYGFGIMSGLRNAQGCVLGWTHADMQADPADAVKGFELFNTTQPELIFVKGKRFGRSLKDVFFTWGMGVFESVLLAKPLWDLNAQPTMFHRDFYKSWQNAPHDFSLDLYAYYTAVSQGYKVNRFPVFFGKRIAGSGHNETINAKLRYSLSTVKYSMELRKNILNNHLLKQ